MYYALPFVAECFLTSTSLAFSAGDSAASSALAAAAAFAAAALLVAAPFFAASASAAFCAGVSAASSAFAAAARAAALIETVVLDAGVVVGRWLLAVTAAVAIAVDLCVDTL